MNERSEWPSLDMDAWRESVETLHMWSQIVGKIRLSQASWVNHSWHCTLYSTTRGLTTSPIPHGERSFEIDFDFIDHELQVKTSEGEKRTVGLESRPTSEFFAEVFNTLDELGLPVTIHASPNEVDTAIPFAENTEHATYIPEGVEAFWGALRQVDRVFKRFRARFIGKVSPVHFFWGSFDHAVTRFSGRTAPDHPGGFPNMPLAVMREAYSHEVSSAGFWPGNRTLDPIIYSYAYPTPEGFADAKVRPTSGTWSRELGEFVLPYEVLRTADDPEDELLQFLESTYIAAAESANWDVDALRRTTIPR